MVNNFVSAVEMLVPFCELAKELTNDETYEAYMSDAKEIAEYSNESTANEHDLMIAALYYYRKNDLGNMEKAILHENFPVAMLPLVCEAYRNFIAWLTTGVQDLSIRMMMTYPFDHAWSEICGEPDVAEIKSRRDKFLQNILEQSFHNERAAITVIMTLTDDNIHYRFQLKNDGKERQVSEEKEADLVDKLIEERRMEEMDDIMSEFRKKFQRRYKWVADGPIEKRAKFSQDGSSNSNLNSHILNCSKESDKRGASAMKRRFWEWRYLRSGLIAVEN